MASASVWVIAKDTMRCQSCEQLIGQGEWVRLVSTGRWPWCVECVKRRVQLDPPERETPQQVAPREHFDLSKFARFSRLYVDRILASARTNARVTVGNGRSREPGEEG